MTLITVKAGCWVVLAPIGAALLPSGVGMRVRSCAKAGVAIRAARANNRRMRILPIRGEDGAAPAPKPQSVAKVGHRVA